MITTLATVKTRLGILNTDQDALLTLIIASVTARFDHLTDRVLARTEDIVDEFEASRRVIIPLATPIESVSSFEIFRDGSWVTATPWAVRIGRWSIELTSQLGGIGERARMTYTGGYVMPGATPGQGQVALPPELEYAGVEEIALAYQTLDNAGIYRMETHAGLYLERGDRQGHPTVLRTLQSFRRYPAT